MRAWLYRGLLSSRLLDLTISSDIPTFTKPQISEYSHFSLYISSEANLFFAAKASDPGIPSADYKKGLTECLRSIKTWMYKYLLSFYAFERAFLGVMRR